VYVLHPDEIIAKLCQLEYWGEKLRIFFEMRSFARKRVTPNREQRSRSVSCELSLVRLQLQIYQ
jgi:hypothetical protein